MEIHIVLEPQSQQHSSWELEPHKVSREQIDPEYAEELCKNQANLLEDLDVHINVAELKHGLQWSAAELNASPDMMYNVTMNVVNSDSYEPIHVPRINRLTHPLQFTHKCIECGCALDFQNVMCDKCLKEDHKKLYLEGEDIRHSELIIGDDDA